MLLFNPSVLEEVCKSIRCHVSEWSSLELTSAVRAAFADGGGLGSRDLLQLHEALDVECAARLKAVIREKREREGLQLLLCLIGLSSLPRQRSRAAD